MQGINGNKMEKACDLCHITLNKNAVVGDVSALAPGGVRVGAPAMTSRGLVEADFAKIADFLHELVLLCLDVQAKTGKLYKDFEKCAPSLPHGSRCLLLWKGQLYKDWDLLHELVQLCLYAHA